MIDSSPCERYPLTFGATPIEPLPRLSAHLGAVPAINAYSYLYRNG